MSDAPLEDIVDLILEVRAGAYSLEAANPRHEHEWRVLAEGEAAAGKILIPGVITHHVMTVEHPQVVADRLVRFANIVGRGRTSSPARDCGFAQAENVQRVHPDIMWAKFEALAEECRRALGPELNRALWGRALEESFSSAARSGSASAVTTLFSAPAPASKRARRPSAL